MGNDSWFKHASDFSSHQRAFNEQIKQREQRKNKHQAPPKGSIATESSGNLDFMYEWMENREVEKWESRDPYRLRFYASQIYKFCPRQWAILMRDKHTLVQDRNGYRDLLVFEHGHAVHDRFQNRIWAFSGMIHGDWKNRSTGEMHSGTCPDESGLWEYQERRVVMPVPGLPDTEEWSLIGKIDADFDPDLADLKSCSPRIYEWLDRAYSRLDGIDDWFMCMGEDVGWADEYARNHTMQLTSYLFAADRPQGWCIYLPKAKVEPPMKEFKVPKRPKVLEAIHRKIEQTHTAWNGGDWKGQLPDMPCKSITCKLAESCPVAMECFKEA